MHTSRETRPVRGLVVALAVLVVLAGVRLITKPSSGRQLRTVASLPPPSTTVVTEAPTTVTTEAPTTAAPAPPPRPSTTVTTAPRPLATVAAAAVASNTTLKVTIPKTVPTIARRAVPRTTPAAPALAAGGGPYRGLGTWVDVYDWTLTYTKNKPTFGPDDVDKVADLGVQTLYLQAARGDTAEDITEEDRLRAILDRAHARNLAVVAWYLPYLTNPEDDMRHIRAIATLGIEGLGLDIESKSVSDADERNRRLVDLSSAVREELPGVALAAIVLPPVVLEVVNTNYWPNFPWQALAPFYDVWMPMSYWTNRTQASGYRDPYRYTVENVDRMRTDLGRPDAVVHPIGGIGDHTTVGDLDGFLRAVGDTHSVGGSTYDFETTTGDQWGRLQALRAT